MQFAFVIGTTETASIDGISAAGASPELMAKTPAADAEIVEYGRPVGDSPTPVSPAGCPTPAVITRAVRETISFETLTIDAGSAAETDAPSIRVGNRPGGDVRNPRPVPAAEEIYERTVEIGSQLPGKELLVGESIPGGTTTALGVFRALGRPYDVSSSLPNNPVELKEAVVSAGLAASDLKEGELSAAPVEAVSAMGDPVLAAASGLVVGAMNGDRTVTLAGGTQMLAVAALVRAAGITEPIELATTSFVANDGTAGLDTACRELDVDLTVTDPEFDGVDHVAFQQYREGVAKEGVGMGGALKLTSCGEHSMDRVHEQIIHCYDRVIDDGS